MASHQREAGLIPASDVAAVYEGDLVVRGPGAREITCAVCGEPVRWCLDMFTFTSGWEDPKFALAHARCLWFDTAFFEQAKRARKDDDGE